MEQASYVRVDPKVLTGCEREPAWLRRVLVGQIKSDQRVEIGPAWDGIHFLLSPRRRAGAVRDTGDPFGLALFGGDAINGYVLDPGEVVRFLDSPAVVRSDRALQRVSASQLRRRFEPGAMDETGIAPGGWGQRGEEGFEYLLDAFLQWRELYHVAAEENQSVICSVR